MCGLPSINIQMRVLIFAVSCFFPISSGVQAQTFQETVSFLLNMDLEKITVDETACVAKWKSVLGNENVLFLNKVIPNETTKRLDYNTKIRKTGTEITLHGEEPIHCWQMTGGGRRCSTSFDRIWTLSSQKAKRMVDALRYLYSKFCTGTKRKRAF